MSDGMLKGRIVLITGCTLVFHWVPSILARELLTSLRSGGIGKATARTLAKQGCSIAMHYNSDAKGAEALTAELRDVSPGTFIIALPDYATNVSHSQRSEWRPSRRIYLPTMVPALCMLL